MIEISLYQGIYWVRGFIHPSMQWGMFYVEKNWTLITDFSKWTFEADSVMAILNYHGNLGDTILRENAEDKVNGIENTAS